MKTELEQMTIDELDTLYFKTFGRLAWHMSRDGYIHFLSKVLNS